MMQKMIEQLEELKESINYSANQLRLNKQALPTSEIMFNISKEIENIIQQSKTLDSDFSSLDTGDIFLVITKEDTIIQGNRIKDFMEILPTDKVILNKDIDLLTGITDKNNKLNISKNINYYKEILKFYSLDSNRDQYNKYIRNKLDIFYITDKAVELIRKEILDRICLAIKTK